VRCKVDVCHSFLEQTYCSSTVGLCETELTLLLLFWKRRYDYFHTKQKNFENRKEHGWFWVCASQNAFAYFLEKRKLTNATLDIWRFVIR
jgi:hypothetical protein